MNLVERDELRRRRMTGCFLGSLLLAALVPGAAIAQATASSSFQGTDNPLNENGAWVGLTSMSPQGTRFQKNNGAFPNQAVGPGNNHAGARTTVAVGDDHYSEIVVGHVENANSYVGPFVRVQTAGSTVDSGYMWWGSVPGGANNWLYRIDANGSSYLAVGLVPHSPFADGDRLRLIARGPVIYGIKNGVREFIYNTGPNSIKYSAGTAGMLGYVNAGTTTLTNATIASWAGGPAPTSSGTWASSTFAGTEDPLDEGDRWYPLPGYSGFKKAGVAIGKDGGHNGSGVWSISPPAKQYSEVTLGTVATGGGGPIVRIDRTNPGQTGWLLLLWADNPTESGIFKVNPDGSFTRVRQFAPTLVTGDKWRLSADGNTLEVSRNGVSQFTHTTDGSYATGDVGIWTLTPAFTLMAWEGGDPAGPLPAITGFTPSSGPVGTSVSISGTNFSGATAVTFNGVSASFTVSSATAIQATVPAGATSGPVAVTTPAGTATSSSAFTVVPPPAIASFAPASGPVGTSVSISGSSFTGATSVTFNGASASFSVTSDTAIQATVPAGATTGPIGVTTSAGTATSSSAFTVVPPPAIASFAPASGPVGTGVSISGSSFTGATAVTFNGTRATFSVTSDTAIQATVPAGATTGPIGVTTPAGTGTSSSAFTVVLPPAIASFAPASGPVGTSVSISGSSFTGATAVTFNGMRATFSVTSDTAIQATVPAGATTGPIGVTTSSGTATSSSAFTVVPPPAIASFAPASGPVGTSVSISGSSFTGATAVTFNGTRATFSVTSDTAIQATVPAGARTGSIGVTTPAGTATSANPFTVRATLNLAKAGNGTGTVTSSSNPASPSQINCGATCSASYDLGTVVTLTATPAAGSTLTSWSGCDQASGTTCTVTMNAARSVTATFSVQTFTLSVQKSRLLLGDGTITSTSNPASPNQINCGSACSATYSGGTVVTLRVTPAFLSTFTGWNDCDSVSGTTCTVNMNSARSVTANFLP